MYIPIRFEDLDQEQCWQYIMGETVQVGKSHLYCSPIRADNHPGCWFRWYNGTLWLVDFGETNYNCVQSWMKIKGLKYWEAITDLKKNCKKTYVKKEFKKEVICEKKITIRSYWRKEHEEYWNLRGLSRPEKVYGVNSYTIEKGCIKTTYIVSDLCFAYKYDDFKYKLYFPNRSKPRFLGNLRSDEVWWSLRRSDTLFITKSHKDFLEAESLLDWDITHVQSEGVKTIPFEWNTYNRIFLNLDGDTTGIQSMSYLISKLPPNVQIILIPNQKSVELVKQFNILSYFPNNLYHLYDNAINSGDFSIPFTDYIESKDLDELITRNSNYKEIFNWLLN